MTMEMRKHNVPSKCRHSFSGQHGFTCQIFVLLILTAVRGPNPIGSFSVRRFIITHHFESYCVCGDSRVESTLQVSTVAMLVY
jgi:hypothetical protein